MKCARLSPEGTGTAIMPHRREVPVWTLRSILNHAHINPVGTQLLAGHAAPPSQRHRVRYITPANGTLPKIRAYTLAVIENRGS